MLLFLFLNYCLILLIAPVIKSIFNPIAELVIAIQIPSKKEKAEMEMHLVTLEAKLSKFSI